MKLPSFVSCALCCLEIAFSNAFGAAAISVSDNVVTVQNVSTAPKFVAIDVSTNLTAWSPMTNIARSGAQISFTNDPVAADPRRFFRLSDADDSFTISGYVNGGPDFGAAAGATVTVTTAGATTQTDANGFFQFDQRFTRTTTAAEINIIAYDRWEVHQVLSGFAEGNFLNVSFDPGLPTPPVSPAIYHFHVKAGPHAGQNFDLDLTGNQFTLSGAFEGSGSFQSGNYPSFAFSASNTIPSQVALFLGSSNSTNGVFAGIPSPKGSLNGNGTFTVEIPPVVFGPTNLTGKAYVLTTSSGPETIVFADTTFSLLDGGTFPTGTTVGTSTSAGTATGTSFATAITTGTSTSTGITSGIGITTGVGTSTSSGTTTAGTSISASNGTYTAVRAGSVWTVTLTTDTSNVLTLTFQSDTMGSFTYQKPGAASLTGQFAFTTTIPGGGTTADNGTYPAPAFISRVTFSPSESFIGLNPYSVALNGGASGTFTVTSGGFGAGTYTYTPSGNSAHLILNYNGDFIGDYDEATLSFNSSSSGSFTGSQKAAQTTAPFSGMFTY